MMEKGIDHFSKASVIKQLSDSHKDELAIVTFQDYPLYVSYNEPTKQIIINISPFGVDTITAINPDPRNMYASLVYGICFRNILDGGFRKVKDSYFIVIVSYLTSMFVQIFGREYGLLGKYAVEINKLKFLISCYILTAFFGRNTIESYILSSKVAMIDYRPLVDQLNTFDFSEIDGLINALAELRVLPGITKYKFTARMFKLLSIVFLPALEDFSRFISIITTSSIQGSNIVPRFISRYNESEYGKILEISKLMMR